MIRYNLIPCVRYALAERNISVVRVCEAINAAIGEIKADAGQSKWGDGKASVKKQSYKITERVSFTRESELTMPLKFDAWHCLLAKADKLQEIPAITIPDYFDEWLVKFVKVEAPKEEASKS